MNITIMIMSLQKISIFVMNTQKMVIMIAMKMIKKLFNEKTLIKRVLLKNIYKVVVQYYTLLSN